MDQFPSEVIFHIKQTFSSTIQKQTVYWLNAFCYKYFLTQCISSPEAQPAAPLLPGSQCCTGSSKDRA